MIKRSWEDFPILKRELTMKCFCLLDNAATTQKPSIVEAVEKLYAT